MLCLHVVVTLSHNTHNKSGHQRWMNGTGAYRGGTTVYVNLSFRDGGQIVFGGVLILYFVMPFSWCHIFVMGSSRLCQGHHFPLQAPSGPIHQVPVIHREHLARERRWSRWRAASQTWSLSQGASVRSLCMSVGVGTCMFVGVGACMPMCTQQSTSAAAESLCMFVGVGACMRMCT